MVMYYTQLMLWVANKCLYLVGKCELIECHRHTFHAMPCTKIYWVNFVEVCCRLGFFKNRPIFSPEFTLRPLLFSKNAETNLFSIFLRDKTLFLEVFYPPVLSGRVWHISCETATTQL